MRRYDIRELDAKIAAAIKCLAAYELERKKYIRAHVAGDPLEAEKLRIADAQIAAEKRTIERLTKRRNAALLREAESTR